MPLDVTLKQLHHPGTTGSVSKSSLARARIPYKHTPCRNWGLNFFFLLLISTKVRWLNRSNWVSGATLSAYTGLLKEFMGNITVKTLHGFQKLSAAK